MNTIEESVWVKGSVEELWREIGSFGGIASWHPLLQSVEVKGSGPGAVRNAKGKDGSGQVERLVEVDSQSRTYRYAIEQSTMPVRDYSAELHVEPEGDDAAWVTWSARFDVASDDPEKTVEKIRTFFRAGLDAIAAGPHR